MVIFVVEMGQNQEPSLKNLLWAWPASISEQKNRKSFVIGFWIRWVRYLPTTKIGKLHLPCSFFCHQVYWSCEVDCLCQTSKALEFFRNSSKKITAICIAVEIPTKSFIYVLSFANKLADLVKSTAHVKFCQWSRWQRNSSWIPSQILLTFLTSKTEKLHLCSFFSHQACWSCKVNCSCQI